MASGVAAGHIVSTKLALDGVDVVPEEVGDHFRVLYVIPAPS